MTLAVANAARLGVGFGMVCADVVESLNAILKRAYNDHTAHAGGGGEAGATELKREGEVVLQAWEWWFLKFDLPLQHHGSCFTSSWTKKCPSWGTYLKPKETGSLCLFCLLLLLGFVKFWAVSIHVCSVILTPATFNI